MGLVLNFGVFALCGPLVFRRVVTAAIGGQQLIIIVNYELLASLAGQQLFVVALADLLDERDGLLLRAASIRLGHLVLGQA